MGLIIMLEQIIVGLLVSTLGTGLFNWILRLWVSEKIKSSIKNEYDQKLETHKAILKAETEIEIEKFKSQLSLVSIEHQIRFSKLHELRAEVIAETYALLKYLYTKLGDYVKLFEPVGDSPRDQRRKAAIIAHEKFSKYFQEKLIFFPKSTADKLEKINADLVKSFNQFSFGVEMASQMGQNSTENWIKVFESVNGQIKEALVEIEGEFRGLLGEKS